MYKHIISFLLILLGLQWANPLIVQAGVLEDYKSARDIQLFAAVCRAAYGDRTAKLVTSGLINGGWKMEHYFQSGDVPEARFFLAKKQGYEGTDTIYLLAVSGTENPNDVKVDLDFDKVYFSGSTMEEIKANAAINPIPLGGAAVHRGFFKYVNTALETRDGNKRLVDHLLEDPSRKVYMVGHSLGGAVVTLAAAYLINIGVQPEQIEVITFGAPAVGNATFAQQMGEKVHLTRIVNHGDPVPSVLKDMVGGYRHFGDTIEWRPDNSVERFCHDMVVYIDVAMKNYYKQINIARNLGILPVVNRKVKAGDEQQCYIAPVVNRLPKGLWGEFGYMREALLERYRTSIPSYEIDGNASGIAESLDITLEKASAAGCKWVLAAEIQGDKVKGEQGLYYFTLYQTVYRVSDGHPMTMIHFGTNTKNMTPLEAVVYEAAQMSETILKVVRTDTGQYSTCGAMQ